ncbi:C-C motif chemokine 3-like [Myripristis murdjan]|uniref:C-C motif chemokine 3-like n=1 Tax=Myripristis murdjan TaxID=586833 RepID=UPI00117635A5|nr:C-C motif chemokine 3-like [Myripristis murdjan]
MKTVCITLGLLLAAVCYCNAVPYAVNWSPAECCFKFYTGKIPKKQIIDVKKTYTNCAESAFVVHTANGRQYCISQSVEWAQAAYNKFNVQA